MASKYYKSRIIYVDAGFAQLLDLISGYLSKLGWYIGEDYEDSLSRQPAQQRWKEKKKEGSVLLVLYAARGHYSIIGSGIILRVLHVRRFIQEGTQPLCSIPKEIRSSLDHLPNIVEIEAHYLWEGDGHNLALLLAQYLTNHGYRACMRLVA